MTRAGWLVASALLLAGCEKIPGTDAHARAAAQKMVAEALTDPESARFRNVEVREATNDKGEKYEIVCGEVNGRNKLGGYVGFTRFVAEPPAGSGFIDPQSTATEDDIIASERLCRSIRSNQFSSPETIRSTCARSNEIIEEISNQAGFDEVWKACD